MIRGVVPEDKLELVFTTKIYLDWLRDLQAGLEERDLSINLTGRWQRCKFFVNFLLTKKGRSEERPLTLMKTKELELRAISCEKRNERRQT